MFLSFSSMGIYWALLFHHLVFHVANLIIFFSIVVFSLCYWGVPVIRNHCPFPRVSRHRVVNQNPRLLTGSLSINFFYSSYVASLVNEHPSLEDRCISLRLAHPFGLSGMGGTTRSVMLPPA